MTITTINTYGGQILTLPGCDVIPWNIDATGNAGIFSYIKHKSKQSALQVKSVRLKGKEWVHRHDCQTGL